MNHSIVPESDKERKRRAAENIKALLDRDSVFAFQIRALQKELQNSEEMTQEQEDRINRQMDESLKRIGAERNN